MKMSYLMVQPHHFDIPSQNLIREMEVHNEETESKAQPRVF